MHELIDKLFVPAFGPAGDSERHDATPLQAGPRVAVSTDSHVVHPLFFPGGNLGSLAVWGTANDLAMAGARPQWLTAGFILEEGLSMEILWRVACSMGQAAQAIGMRIVAGDTKVVERGKADGLYINTTGLGTLASPAVMGPEAIRPGDAIVLSGDLGRHAVAVMAAREHLELETPVQSDLAPLWPLVRPLIEAGLDVHALRDLTRGGLASALCELAACGGVGFEIEEDAIHVSDPVMSVCELLGFDPMHAANEGRFVAFLPIEHAERAREILRQRPECMHAHIIGRVLEEPPAQVLMHTSMGTRRCLDMLSGEQLPRIC